LGIDSGFLARQPFQNEPARPAGVEIGNTGSEYPSADLDVSLMDFSGFVDVRDASFVALPDFLELC
jgi:hypothetical protein